MSSNIAEIVIWLMSVCMFHGPLREKTIFAHLPSPGKQKYLHRELYGGHELLANGFLGGVVNLVELRALTCRQQVVVAGDIGLFRAAFARK